MATPESIIERAARRLKPFEEAPNEGDWLVCPTGHVIAQYVRKERTGLKDWGKLSGAVVSVQFGRRVISCSLCGAIADASPQELACRVVPDKAVKEAIALIG